jgi:hypothetical protein
MSATELNAEFWQAPALQAARDWPRPLPNDLRMAVLVLDPEHAHAADALMQQTRNADAIAMLRHWQRYRDRLPFLVVAAPMRRGGGIIGGLAPDWLLAQCMIRYTCLRLNDLATQSCGFSSAWVLLLDDERRKHAQTLLGELQQTGGSA